MMIEKRELAALLGEQGYEVQENSINKVRAVVSDLATDDPALNVSPAESEYRR